MGKKHITSGKELYNGWERNIYWVGKKYIMGGKEIYNKVGKKILMAPLNSHLNNIIFIRYPLILSTYLIPLK